MYYIVVNLKRHWTNTLTVFWTISSCFIAIARSIYSPRPEKVSPQRRCLRGSPQVKTVPELRSPQRDVLKDTVLLIEWATYRLSYNLRSDESIMLDACLKKTIVTSAYIHVKLWCMIWICVNMWEYVCILTSTYKLYSINMNKQQQTKLKELWLDWTNTIHPTYHYKQHNQPLQNTHTQKEQMRKRLNECCQLNKSPSLIIHYPLLGSVTDPLKWAIVVTCFLVNTTIIVHHCKTPPFRMTENRVPSP